MNVSFRCMAGSLIFVLAHENQTDHDEMLWLYNTKIIHETRNFAEMLFFYFTKWERERTGCRSKLSNQERRWPGTDVSNILVFGPREGWSVSVCRTVLKTRSGEERISAGGTAGVRAGMFKVLSAKAPTVSDCTSVSSWFKTTLSPVFISSESAAISLIPSDRHLVISCILEADRAASSDTEGMRETSDMVLLFSCEDTMFRAWTSRTKTKEASWKRGT